MALLDGKVIVVTGATSGIGEAAAREIAAAGGVPVLAGRRVERGEAIAAEIVERGGQALFVPTDVTRREEIERLVGRAVEQFGRLDGAFNNAGFAPPGMPIESVPVEQYEQAMQVNARSVFWSVQAEATAMKQTGGGAIVNCSSIAGTIAFAYFSAYIASKHAIVGITKSAAIDLGAHNIRVNCVLPSIIDTELWEKTGVPREVVNSAAATYPLARVAHAREVAQPVVFLLSDWASYITGAALPVDGGATAM